MTSKNARVPFFLIVLVALLTALGGFPRSMSATPPANHPTGNSAAFSALAARPAATANGSSLPAAYVIETFPNEWHSTTIGLVYNPISDTVRYAHEGQAANPATIWDVAYTVPHTPLLGISLAAINGGWPVALNDRDGLDYDPVAGTYFVTDFQGDLSTRDDNLIEITPEGVVLNAWELDGADNDSSDASAINTIIDIAIVPGPTPRYFVTRAEGAGTIYEIGLTRAGLFTPNSWHTIGSCEVPIGDNVGIDYDSEYGVLYHSSFNNETIMVTDLDCNPLGNFTCDGGSTSHTGITRIEGSDPQEVWVTDFTSNTTTRCVVPTLTMTKIASLGDDCATPVSETYPGTQITYCYEVTNLSNPAYTPVYTFTHHTLVDDHLGTILSDTAQLLAPGDSFSTTTTTILTQTTVNQALWTATDDPDTVITLASASVTVLNSPPGLCTTYASTNVPVLIVDNRTVTSTLTVPDSIALFDVNVALTLTHSWDADLILSLTGPTSGTILLSNQRGGGNDNYTGTIFDSQASTPIAAGAAPFSGRFSPEQSLNILNGTDSSGVWTLNIQDTANGDQGALVAWSVELCSAPTSGLSLTQTVGTTPGVCATTDEITVTAGTEVNYCYEITNTGNYTVTHHTLTDSALGTLLDNAIHPLGPGQSVNTVDLGITATRQITGTTTTTATWSAALPGLTSAEASGSTTVTATAAEELTYWPLIRR